MRIMHKNIKNYRIYNLFPILYIVNKLEKKNIFLNNLDLSYRTLYFIKKRRLGISGNSILCESFSVVRETSKRLLNERHYDVQILCGSAMYMNFTVEMKTGEGKTLSSLLTSYINFLNEKKTYILTINNYLSNRDYLWMFPVYNFHKINSYYANLKRDKCI